MTPAAFAATLLLAAGPGSGVPQGPQVPLPELAGLEDVVREQLREAHRSAESALADPALEPEKRSAIWGRLGQLYYAYGLSEGASACFAEASRAQPDAYRWVYYRASLAREAGELEQAVALYEEALELNPRDPASLVYLADVLVEYGLLDEAEARLRELLAASPQSPVAMARLGELALARGENAAAVDWLERALEQLPQADRLHYPLALAYRALGDTESARKHLSQRGRVGVAPPDPALEELRSLREGQTVHLLRARRAFAAGDYAAAAESFREAVAAAPEAAGARVGLAAALEAQGRYEEALLELRAALQLDPSSDAARFDLAIVLARLGDRAGAIHHLRLLVARHPDDEAGRFQLARFLREAGLFEEAAAEFARLVSINPGHEGARVGQAAALADAGRLGEALDLLESAHRERPDSGLAAHALARLLAAGPDPERRDGPRALDLALRVFEAQSSAEHAETVALALAELGRCAEAAQWQREALAAVRAERPTVRAARVARMSRLLERLEGDEGCRPIASPDDE